MDDSGNIPSRQERRNERLTGHQRRTQQQRQKSRLRVAIVGIIVALLTIISVVYTLVPVLRAQGGGPGSPIDGIQCGAMEGAAEHIHSHVALFDNGIPVTMPAFIGIPVNQHISEQVCFYWLHTHALTNVVHIEAPVSGTYTLGQFVDIWRQTARWDAQNAIAGGFHVNPAFANALARAPQAQVHIYIGKAFVGHNYHTVTFADHRDITVELGKPLQLPVTSFNWKTWQGL